VKRKRVLTILLAYLLTSGLYLLSPGEGAWAVPGQNPNRQSCPSRTPTPAATLTPGTATATPVGTTVPQPPSGEPSLPLPLPAETVTPLFLTLFPPTATPTATPRATWESVLWQTATAEEGGVLAGSTSPTPVEMGQPTPSRTPISAEVGTAITPVASPSLGSALGASACVDLLVIGIGLVLLVIGLILVGRRRASSQP